MARRVERTRNGGKWTEAEFFSRLRSALRNVSTYWYPAALAMKRARGHCELCGKKAKLQKDHIVPCGTFRSLADMPAFCELLFIEDPAGYQCLCDECHQAKTRKERVARDS